MCEWGILISGACQTYSLTYSPLFSLVILAPRGDIAQVFSVVWGAGLPCLL